MEIDKAVIINALYNRIKAGQLSIEQIPPAYREEIQALIDKESDGA